MNARLLYVLATAIGMRAWNYDFDPGTQSVQHDTNDDSDPGTQSVPTIPFEVLHSGRNSGFTRNSEFVIQDSDEFTRRWKGVQQGAPDAALPTVDFEKIIVVLVAMGTRNTDGHSVRVDSVTMDSATTGAPVKSSSGTTVHYTVTSPGARCMSMQMLTSPIEVISFERVTGVVKFRKRSVSGGC